jgi:hypothetical protein
MELSNSPTSEQDLQILPQMITAWKSIQNEAAALKQQLREKVVKQKALEEVIMRVMKAHQIGALDLKASNGRLSRKERKSKETLTTKKMTEWLGEYLKSEEAGKKAVEYMDGKRGIKTLEKLTFEDL